MKLTLRNCCLLLITMLLASYAGMGLGLLPRVPLYFLGTRLGGGNGVQQPATPKSSTSRYTSPVHSFEVSLCIPTTSDTAIAACKNYTWNGQTYTSSGNYTWTGTNAAGCDSTATLKLDIINNNDSLVVGANMFGGKIGYILQAGDPGYDATKIKGLVVGISDLTGQQWGLATTGQTNVITKDLGAGASNTATLVGLNGPGNYYAYTCDTLTLGGYTDWYLPSQFELYYILSNYQALGIYYGVNGTNNYWPSNENPTLDQSIENDYFYYFDGNFTNLSGSKTGTSINARPVRSFEITPCIPTCNPTTSFAAVAACKNYTWNGQTYTSSGTYTWTGTNAGGCDSTATLKLDIISNNDSLVVGANMFGGKIGYILEAGDPGYDASKIKGFVVGNSDYSGQPWSIAPYQFSATGVIDTTLGAGAANTAALVRLMGPGGYAAYRFDTLSIGGYKDWYLPSKNELKKIITNYAILNLFYFHPYGTNYYFTSSEYDFMQAVTVGYLGPNGGSMVSASPGSKGLNQFTRPVRSFEVTVCNPEPPTSPTALAVIPTSTGGVVNFTAPANDGGAAITNYEYSIDNGANWVTPSPAVTSGSLTISGLNNCTDYQVKVRAVNSAGAGTETAAVTLSTRESKQPGIDWVIRLSNQRREWKSIAYGNGLYVAVGISGSGNRVMTSPDGINWTSRTSSADNAWRSVTFGNGLFVAVASTGSGNRVMTSPDGITWTSRVSAANNYWTSVTYGNGLFVAVGATGTGNRVMTSPDGITWTVQSSAADNEWYSVTYGDGLFVAVAAYSGVGNRVMTSPDGINWTSRVSAADNEWMSVTYGNGKFVAVAVNPTQSGVMTSPDGINWTTSQSANANNWCAVTYGNGLFVALASGGSNQDVMTSPDGMNWTSRTTITGNEWSSIKYVNGMFVAAASYSSESDNIMTSTFSISSDAPVINSVNASSDSLSISFTQTLPALASAVKLYEYSVDNGANWIAKSAADTISPLRIGGLDKGYPYQVKLRAVNAGGTSCESAMVNFCLPTTSTDTVGVSGSYTWNGQTYTASGIYIDTLVSTGGCDSIVSLHLTIIGPASVPTEVVVIPTGTGGVVNFTAPANDGGAAITNYEYSIDNGANWVTPSPAVTSGSLTISGLNNCTEYQVKVRAVNVAGIGAESAAVTLSTRESKLPGDAWIKSDMGTSITWNGIAYGNGTFVTVAKSPYSSRRVSTSPDGINWTEGNVGVFGDWRDWTDVAYGNGLFVAVASSGGSGNRVMTSSDGITWTDRSSAADNSWSAITYGNGLFVAVAYSGIGNRVMTSPDGINWTIRTSAADNNWFDVTYGNGLFVAVASSGTGNRVMTSPDGINWTSRISSDDYDWAAVTYGNGLFVAVSDNSAQNKVMTSVDGINWTSSTAIANGWSDIAFGSGRFVAISYQGTTNDIMTSSDGINWTAITTQQYSDLSVIGYTNSRFVIASSIGEVYNSTYYVSADAPVIDSINIVNDSLAVRFTQTLPSLASNVTQYEYTVDNGANWTAKSAADTTSPLRIGGLVKGNSYQVKLRAVNSGGTSCESAMVNFCLPTTSSDTVDVCGSYSWNGQTYTASGIYADTLVSAGGCDSIATLHLTIKQNPTTPTNLVATPINEGAMIQFTAPAGSSSYTSYEYSTNNGSSWITPDTAISASPLIISGLTNCNDYLVKIRAVTSCSTSDASESFAVTPRAANVPGIDWSMSPYQANPSYSEFYQIVYGNGIYVATSQDYTNNPVVTSTDGINWTTVSPGTNLGLYAIVFDGNRFVGLTGENAGNKIAISQDGINWTVSDLNVTFKASSITYGNGMYVAVSNRGVGDRIMSSPDALNWTIRTSPTTNYFGSVTWGNGLFVALSTTGTNRIITSPDGINWTAQVAPTTSNFGKLIYGNGIFMASSYNGGTNSIMTSPDGINWSLQTTPRNAASITYGNNLFVAVGSSGSGNRVMTSPDGITWTQGKSAGDYTWTDVAYGDGKFVALSLFGPNVSMVSTFSPAADAPVIDSVSINLDTAVVHFSQTKPDLATAVTNYEYSIDNGANWTANSPTAAISPLALTGFTPGVTYPVKIRAINSAGASCESNAVSVNICSPTSSIDSVTACDSYTWHGNTYTASTNTATWVTTNARGCDSTITLVLTITPKLKWFKDNDGDGFGTPTDSTYACSQPIGYVSNKTDCNDGDKKTSPNKYWYKDKDGDGHGSKKPEDRKQSCEKPKRDDDKLFVPGDYVDNDLDCNDDDSTINGNTVWYKDADNDGYSNGDTLVICEQPLGYKLLINLLAATGDCDDTNASIRPNSSTAATSILASSTTVTMGGSITLSVNGGSLGASDTWKWYTGSCGGTAIGSGTSIVVSPAVTTTYYLRAEGCTNTDCVSVTITACGPTGVTSNAANSTICSGTSTTLTVQGVLAGAASWKWYKNACGYDESRSGAEGAIGTGASLKVSPTSTTTYYVRSEGGICGKTSCKSITITVNPKPAKPVSMTVPAKICKQATIQLTVGAVNSATSYTWTVPKGWSIVSGQGTRTVVVKTGKVSADVKVAAVNSCGSSAVYTKRITLGNCNATSSAVLVTSAIRPMASEEVDTDAALNIQTYPNPTTNYFTVRNNNSFVIQLRMVQASGQVVEAFSQVQPGAAVEFGARYRPGIYLVEATGNGLRTTKKVIKH